MSEKVGTYYSIDCRNCKQTFEVPQFKLNSPDFWNVCVPCSQLLEVKRKNPHLNQLAVEMGALADALKPINDILLKLKG